VPDQNIIEIEEPGRPAIGKSDFGGQTDRSIVIMFNPDTNRSEDVSYAVAHELLRRIGLEGREIPRELEDFIDRHVGTDRQLTLQLVVA
jgi:hypothetical protein